MTLPREVRISLGISPGDRLDFIRLEDCAYAIVPASHSVRALKGLLSQRLLSQRESALSLKQMDAAIEAGAKDD